MQALRSQAHCVMDRLFRVDFYPQDWLVDTSAMTLEQRGFYIQVVALIYAKRGPIANDPEHLAKLSRCSVRLARSLISQLVDGGFIQLSGEKITQKRCELELNSKRNALERSAKGGRNRAEKHDDPSNNKGVGISANDVSLPSTSPTPSPTPKEEVPLPSVARAKPGKPPLLSRLVIDAAFEEFWAAYPRKKGKGAAEKKFSQAVLKADPDVIIAAVRAQRFDDDPQFRPLPATWLNQKRWLDEIEPTPTATILPFAAQSPASPDEYGLRAWFDRQPDGKVTEKGNWDVNGWYVDIIMPLIAAAARFPDDWTGNLDALGKWLRDNIWSDDCIAAIRQVASRVDYRPPQSLAYFDIPVRNAGQPNRRQG